MYNLIGAGLIVIGAGIGLGQIGGKAMEGIASNTFHCFSTNLT